MHYVIGDVHGCLKELQQIISKIEAKDDDARYIFVGDFIDRGSESYKVLKWMMEHITEDGKYQSVRGNHEQLVIEWYEKWLRWYEDGGVKSNNPMPETTYDFSEYIKKNGALYIDRLDAITGFFQKLPTRKELEINGKKYCIVHAWDWNDKNLSEESRSYMNIWNRDFQATGNFENDTIIVHGHTPTFLYAYRAYDKTIPGMIGYRRNSINLDGGCCFKNDYYYYPCMLCAICLETMEEIYNTSIEERFREINKGKSEEEIVQIIDDFMKIYEENV